MTTVEDKTETRISYMQAIVQAQMEEMLRDERVILMGEDIATYGGGALYKHFEDKRLWSTPISENAFSGMAVGAAMTGLRPIVDLTIASFVYLASDPIINQASKMRYMTGGQMQVPVVFRACMYYGNSLAAQHSDRPYTAFLNSPGLKIIAPSTPADMKGLLKSAIRDDDPVLVFEDMNLWAKKDMVSTDPECLIPIGKADIKREGRDITLVSISGCLPKALAAATALDKEGISVEVIDPRTLVPLDKATIIKSVRKTGHLIIVDNAHRTGSMASEIAASIGEEVFGDLKKPVRRLTAPDVHMPFSPALEKNLYPNKDSIIAAIKAMI